MWIFALRKLLSRVASIISRNAFNILEESEASVPETTILKIVMAVASALEYMHEKGFSHRDIKLENVLKNEK